MPKLVIFRGDAVEKEVPLAKTTVRIGRHADNDVVLDDSLKSVSRFHAEIRPEGDAYVIVDLKSRNGIWVNAKRVAKATLALGAPVTLGAYELVLEDLVASGEFDDEVGFVHQRTVAATAHKDRTARPSGSATRRWSIRPPVSATRRQILVWSGFAATLLLIGVIVFAVVRYSRRPAMSAQVVVQQPLPSASPSPPPEQPAPVEDPNKVVIDQHLGAARTQLEAHDYDNALRDHLLPILALEPANEEALSLKRQADDALLAAQAPPKTPRAAAKPTPAPVEAEIAGVPRKANEAYGDYTARAGRARTNLSEGKRSLEKDDYTGAIRSFRSVVRDQPGYQSVEQLIAEAIGKQQKTFHEAMDNGQKSEAAKQPELALKWYRRAEEIDGTAQEARDKIAAMSAQMDKDAALLFNKASFFEKSGEVTQAIGLYQQIVDSMPHGNEVRAKAVLRLEALKK